MKAEGRHVTDEDTLKDRDSSVTLFARVPCVKLSAEEKDKGRMVWI